MYKFHPQWDRVRQILDERIIGDITFIESLFTYFKDDPQNIRSDPDKGGGGLMDIGVYCTSVARWLFGKEPLHVDAQMKMHPQWNVDVLAQGMMDFGEGQYSSFTCGTQSFGDQFVRIYGTKGKIVVPRKGHCSGASFVNIFADSGEGL